jgi:hypothetical protein
MLKKLVAWANGRHTMFAGYFALTGTALQLVHKLDGNFIALIAAVQAFVFAHSAQENYFDKDKDKKDEEGKGGTDVK